VALKQKQNDANCSAFNFIVSTWRTHQP